MDTFADMDGASGLEQGIAAVLRGDARAARRLVAHVHPLLVRLVRGYRARHCSDEDLLQEVYLRMFSKLDQYRSRPGVPFEHWLSRLCVNTCRDQLRHEARRPALAQLDEQGSGWLDTLVRDREPPQGEQVAARELVDALLDGLPPRDRLLLTLLDLEGLSVAEVHARTGWGVSLIKVRAHRARKRLRSLAQRLDGAGP